MLDHTCQAGDTGSEPAFLSPGESPRVFVGIGFLVHCPTMSPLHYVAIRTKDRISGDDGTSAFQGLRWKCTLEKRSTSFLRGANGVWVPLVPPTAGPCDLEH